MLRILDVFSLDGLLSSSHDRDVVQPRYNAQRYAPATTPSPTPLACGAFPTNRSYLLVLERLAVRVRQREEDPCRWGKRVGDVLLAHPFVKIKLPLKFGSG